MNLTATKLNQHGHGYNLQIHLGLIIINNIIIGYGRSNFTSISHTPLSTLLCILPQLYRLHTSTYTSSFRWSHFIIIHLTHLNSIKETQSPTDFQEFKANRDIDLYDDTWLALYILSNYHIHDSIKILKGYWWYNRHFYITAGEEKLASKILYCYKTIKFTTDQRRPAKEKSLNYS